MNIHPRTLLVSILFVSLTIMVPNQPSDAQQRDQARRSAAADASYRILIKKAERKLYLYVTNGGQEKLAKTYRIALGSSPTGEKRRQGDGATPEGDYYITHKNPSSRF